ncbi:MAG: ribosome-associated heat shock protein Hsp15 [Paracoccaceae bacterium]
MNEARPTIRLDKWLYFARFFKTRTLSGKVITSGHVRVNSQKILKSSAVVGAGDTLTFAQEQRIRVIEIVDIGSRRGPADEAQALYKDLTPPEEPSSKPLVERGGRPTKQDRRAVLRMKGKET